MAAMLEAEILAAEIEAAGSGEMMPAEALVVVETVYPRPYLGRAWTREELLHQSQVTVHGPYATVAAAVEQARDVRDGCGRFPPRTAATGPPPWDSGAEAGDRDADTSVEVRAAGRVHYSDPPEAYDIRADLDVDAAAASSKRPSRPRPRSASPSARRRRRARPRRRSWPSWRAAARWPSSTTTAVRRAAPADACVAAIAALPGPRRALALLRVRGRIAPATLGAIAHLEGLERLDVSDCFSSEFFDHEADPPVYPYDAPLAACFERLPRLRYVDFGHGDDDALATFWGYCFSQDRVEALRERFPAVECSMAEAKHSPLPHPFPGGLSLDDQRDVEVDYNDSYGESGESDSS
ncbi:N-acetylgalactosamine 4-sulfate 6-O-sulfotransferase [Aureococcus anophagefferens]|nr:N-acetylgalactosamine 4-sulfate 6-O-sulfotransferase [Aureococcus anophagefferens]